MFRMGGSIVLVVLKLRCMFGIFFVVEDFADSILCDCCGFE